ncbi:MAG: serine protease [Kiritimatiellaeota bacterium]|nr:serine protease [Kiritimatiellota bacterium]
MKRTMLVVLMALGWVQSGLAEDGATPLVECTFKLFNRDSTGTCFLLHPDDAPKDVYLVTASHVFQRMTNDEALLVLRVPGSNDTFSRKDYPLKVKRGNQPTWYKHPSEDIAVLKLPTDPKQAFPSLPFSCLADEKMLKKLDLHICSDVFIFGYPTRFEANNAGFPIGRHGSISSHPLTPISANKFFLVDFSTFEGDSGGPVFVTHRDQPVILGIVLAQFRHDERVKTLYEENIIHHPLNISKVVHAAFIREAVLAAAKVPSPGK